MHPVRKTILEILKRQGYATVNDLADALDMAPVSVRHHLDLLIGDGLVDSPRVRRTAGAGRPQQVYALLPAADAYFPNNYLLMADESLRALKQSLPQDAMLGIMAEVAGRTAAQAPDDLPQMPPREQAVIITGFLNEHGYMADYEWEETSFVIHTCNCPYSDLAASHPELCHMDLMLVGQLAGTQPQRVAHIADGDARCSYRICTNGLRSSENGA
ncbi:MAG: helix-turn-helix domain-containing protein [Caldilineales bacterium]|nr:helix-turn-helix domain-containing protein [Caldilineales bacterium]